MDWLKSLWSRVKSWARGVFDFGEAEIVVVKPELKPAPAKKGPFAEAINEAVRQVTDPGPDEIVALYLRYGEGWELDQREYVNAFTGRELQFEAALDRVNIPAMVASWSDATIKARAGDVPTLSFNGQQRAALARAINAEAHKRFSPPPAKHNGMTE